MVFAITWRLEPFIIYLFVCVCHILLFLSLYVADASIIIGKVTAGSLLACGLHLQSILALTRAFWEIYS